MSGTWTSLPKVPFQRLHHNIISIYRTATGCSFSYARLTSMFTDEDMIHEYNLITPLSMIRANRLCLFHRMRLKKPAILLPIFEVLASINVGWPSTIRSDMSWLASSGSVAMPHSLVDFHPQSDFSKQVKKFSASRFANLDLPKKFPLFGYPINLPPLVTSVIRIFLLSRSLTYIN